MNTSPGEKEAPAVSSWSFVPGKDGVVALGLAAVALGCKLSTLDTPFFWDECSWSRFAWTLHGDGIWTALPGLHDPPTYAGHPPGLHGAAALLFALFGPSISLAHAIPAGFGALGVAFTYLLGSAVRGRACGLIAATLLLANPLYFTQSGFFLADLPVAALGVATVFFALRGHYSLYLLTGLCLVAMKESAMAIVFAVAAYFFFRDRARFSWAGVRRALRWGAPLLAAFAYYTWQRVTTGQFFYIYSWDVDLVNLGSGFIWTNAKNVTRWLFAHQLRWLLTALIACWLVRSRSVRREPVLGLFALITLCSGYTFSFLHLLPRYVLPVAPYLFVVGAWALLETLRRRELILLAWTLFAALSVSLHFGSEFPKLIESDMRYLRMVRRDVEVANFLEDTLEPDEAVLTAFPHSVYLSRPYLGYVSRRLRVLDVRRAGLPSDAKLVLVASPFGRDARSRLAERVRAERMEEVYRVVDRGVDRGVYRPASD